MINKDIGKGVAIGLLIGAAIVLICLMLEKREQADKKAPLATGNRQSRLIAFLPTYTIASTAPRQEDSFAACMERALDLKAYIENRDGYKMLYNDDGTFKRENIVGLLFKLLWRDTSLDTNYEVNNGRGHVDFKASHGRANQTLVEFKLASNSQLKKNLEKQIDIYAQANYSPGKIVVIVFHTPKEEQRVQRVLTALGKTYDDNIILIDARNDNKQSASTA